jgi:hypothetical protein
VAETCRLVSWNILHEGMGVRESEPAEEGSVLEQGFLVMGRKGRKEGGVSVFEDLGTSSALAGERDVLVDRGRLARLRMEERKRVHDSKEAARARGDISAWERMPRPPRRAGRVMMS